MFFKKEKNFGIKVLMPIPVSLVSANFWQRHVAFTCTTHSDFWLQTYIAGKISPTVQ